MTDIADVFHRIERRLEALGLTASAASKKAGLSTDAIRNIKRAVEANSSRHGVSTRTIARLAPVLQTSVGWLLEGRGDEAVTHPGQRVVPLVGHVGAGAAMHYYSGAQGPLDEVPAPEGSSDRTVAVEIRGDSLGPVFDHWLVFYDDVRRPVSSDLVGRLCVVGLADGRVLIKKIKRSRTRGFYHLLSQTVDPILDVQVEWAAKVNHMAPR